MTLLPWQALLAANLAWSVYSLITAQPPLLVSYTVAVIVAVIVIGKLARDKPRNLTVSIGIPVAAGLGMLLTLPIPILFGIITVVPSTIGWIMQLVRIRRSGRPPGLSITSLLLYLTCLLTWLTYALIVRDLALAVSTMPLILVISMNIGAFSLAPRAATRCRHDYSPRP
ncbi:MAG: hypothetical protein B5766_07755 [Candidatus Lumbricidophila eiseniae]|uniref:Uncharacterized protein n=1 Tax=Candidatus Lumbricidiphila eiseniae TaxID=1969409 RepID=A0A2A6FRQ7_9MICO|nr:MAG: hypothetical protein B5766_07755 [Candidatus Lumbricidophila eiseniae]